MISLSQILLKPALVKSHESEECIVEASANESVAVLVNEHGDIPSRGAKRKAATSGGPRTS